MHTYYDIEVTFQIREESMFNTDAGKCLGKHVHKVPTLQYYKNNA